MGLLLLLITTLQPYAGPAILLGYPLYQSIHAIESPHKEDDEQWLTYWVIYSFIALFELAAESVLEVITVWPYIKLGLGCWLILPQFRGACFIYRNYVRTTLWKLQHLDNKHDREDSSRRHSDSSYSDNQKRVLGMMSSEASSAVALYISEHGPDAFEKLITSAAKHSSKSNSPKTPKVKSPSTIKHFFERKHSPT